MADGFVTWIAVEEQKLLMKKRLILLSIVILTLGSFGLSGAVALMNMKPGDMAPDFQIRSVDGKELTLSSLKGDVVILAFWKRSHDNSERAMADLERIYQEYRDRGVTVMAINGDKTPEPEIRRIRADRDLSYLLAGDPDLKVYGLFGVITLPTTLVIGPGGVLAYYLTIHTRDFYAQVRGYIRVLLGEITPAQLEAELSPKKIDRDSDARKKAIRHLNFARVLMKAGLNDKARNELEKAVQADPLFPEPHILLARLYLQDKKVHQVGTELEYAFRQIPGSKDAAFLQGISYASRGKDDLALSVFKGLLKNNPEPLPEAYYQIGRIYERQNKPDQALEAYQRALELIPAE